MSFDNFILTLLFVLSILVFLTFLMVLKVLVFGRKPSWEERRQILRNKIIGRSLADFQSRLGDDQDIADTTNHNDFELSLDQWHSQRWLQTSVRDLIKVIDGANLLWLVILMLALVPILGPALFLPYNHLRFARWKQLAPVTPALLASSVLSEIDAFHFRAARVQLLISIGLGWISALATASLLLWGIYNGF